MRIIGLLLIIALASMWPANGYAQVLSNRSVQLASAKPAAVTDHQFSMTLSSSAAIGSVAFEYCANSPLFEISCDPPAGLSLSSASLSQQTGNVGFSIDTLDSTASRLVISRPTAAALAVSSSYTFSNVTNPSTNSVTTYVRITTYAGTQGTGSPIDSGAVAFTTLTNFDIGAYVPPFLNLCVGVTVAVDCAQGSGDSLDLGELDSRSARSATSQFSTSTNDPTGCIIYALGTTMTAGNNIIPAVINQPSTPGRGQFGINLRQNTNPAVGTNPDGYGSLAPASGYDVANQYSFDPGARIASSPISTDYSRLTVAYVTNISPSQPPGIYSATITYLASAQF